MNHYWRTGIRGRRREHLVENQLYRSSSSEGSIYGTTIGRLARRGPPEGRKTEGKVPSVSDPRALAHLLELILSTAQAGLAFSRTASTSDAFARSSMPSPNSSPATRGSVRTGRELDRPGQPLPDPETGRPCVDPRLATAGPAGPRGLGWSLDPTRRLVRRKRVAGRCGSSRNPGRKRTGSSSDTPVGIAGQAQASPPSPTAACVESLLLLPRHRWQASATNGRNVGGRVLPGGRLAAAFRAPGTGLADPDVMAANPRRNTRGAFRLGHRPHGIIARQTAFPNGVQQAHPADRPTSR